MSAAPVARDDRPAADPGVPVSTQLARRALFGFILTFIAARTVVLLIMSRRMPNLYFFLRGTHVHHLNYGIFLLAGVGAYLLFRIPSGKSLRGAALVYGIAMALTFDEFGMWLQLLAAGERRCHHRGRRPSGSCRLRLGHPHVSIPPSQGVHRDPDRRDRLRRRAVRHLAQDR
jgi:hypothetical protein